MGQRCPCLIPHRIDPLITKDLDRVDEYYSTTQEKRVKAGHTEKISIDIRLFETNLELLTVIQRWWIKTYYKNQICNILPKENQEVYDKFIVEYTTKNIEKSESVMNEFVYSKRRKPQNLLFFCKIILREDGLYSGFVDILTKRNGEGFLITKDGKKYIGEWEDGFLKGNGRFIDSNGDFYEGSFLKNQLDGEGKCVRFDKEYCYEGKWINGIKHGKGKEETNEYIYEGDFENNLKHGNGKKYFKYLDEFYLGEFRDDEMTGKGIYVCKNKDTFTGEFLKGKMHGNGLYKWGDGSEYKGEYLNNVKEGYGEYKTQCGKIYKGQFINGKPHGVGEVEYNGKVKKVEFFEGKIVKKSKK